MKKGVFLLSMLMMVSTLGAMEGTKHSNSAMDYDPYYNDKSIAFVERGIKFYVFLDGAFDFNTAPTAEVDYIYRNRRYTKHRSPRGIRIERDYQGRIRRIGNVFISYTFNDKIKRIGSVFIKYRHGRMKKVGNLSIYYYPYDVEFVGRVKGYNYYNPYYSYGWSSFNTWNNWSNWEAWEYGYYDPFFDDDNFFDEYESFDEDDNYYYYRSKANKSSKGRRSTSKGKIIKRKKAKKSRRNEVRKKVAVPKKILKSRRSTQKF